MYLYKSPFYGKSKEWTNSGSEYNACLNFLPDMSHGYIEGYKSAGEILADFVTDGISKEEGYRGGALDMLIYPILFLYRHHLEIRFKGIIKVGKQLLNQNGDYNDGHGLTNLWSESKTIITSIYTHHNQDISTLADNFDFIRDMVADLESKDPSYDAFRYWEGSKKSKRVKSVENIAYVDIKIYQQNMRQATNFLDEIDDRFDEMDTEQLNH